MAVGERRGQGPDNERVGPAQQKTHHWPQEGGPCHSAEAFGPGDPVSVAAGLQGDPIRIHRIPVPAGGGAAGGAIHDLDKDVEGPGHAHHLDGVAPRVVVCRALAPARTEAEAHEGVAPGEHGRQEGEGEQGFVLEKALRTRTGQFARETDGLGVERRPEDEGPREGPRDDRPFGRACPDMEAHADVRESNDEHHQHDDERGL
mmetsp:Transcript_125307/g.217201  ORF Transcript_125307/g.217201 Transcript_125307/m.217201 type:complete len:203 (+) Transcript_125307:2888-3496(+)